MKNSELLAGLIKRLKAENSALKKAVFNGNLGEAGYRAGQIQDIEKEMEAIIEKMLPTPVTTFGEG